LAKLYLFIKFERLFFMKTKLIISALLICSTLSRVIAMQNNADHVLGQLIVQLDKSNLDINDLINHFDKKIGLRLESMLSEPLAIYLLTFNTNEINENDLLQKVNANVIVKAVQFNHFVEERVLEPNDPNFTNGTMWSLKNTGQNGGTNDADVDAPEAWELCTGGITVAGDTVVVAVIDGGFFMGHVDINFWKNYEEIAGNNIDDDGNGYIDDVNGWNAYNNNGTITSSQHGTHVSGTVAAKGNNNIGVVGINWNAKVMAIQGSSGTEATVVAAYAYAFKQRQLYNQSNGDAGAFVVATNSSFGVNNGNPANFPIWCGMYDSLGSVGILSAGATANANYNIDVTGDMPTACPQQHLITVTNTDKNDVKNTGAGYGLTTIDLGAPGTSVSSTTPNNQYASLTGTSMATPHVAGAVGLMISYACPLLLQAYKQYPDSISLLFKEFMLNNVDANTSLQSNTVSGGRLNLFNSLQAINQYCITTDDKIKEIAELFITDLTIQPNPAGDYLQLMYSLPNSGNVSIDLLDITGRLVKHIERSNFSEGYHSHTVYLEDIEAGVYCIQLRSGNSSSQTKKFVKL
jgi:hypothetical protein